jgi:hypothetical protein
MTSADVKMGIPHGPSETWRIRHIDWQALSGRSRRGSHEVLT